MRALTGAIIAAASLLGLGLVALGMGTRYQYYSDRDKEGAIQWLRFSQMDTPFIYLTILLTVTLVIGLGIAFIGLAYHHHRRHHELLAHHEEHKTRSRAAH